MYTLAYFNVLITDRELTNWGRVTHIWVSKLTIIGSDNGLSHGRRQAIIWTNAGILLIGLIGTNVSEILIAILTFSFKKTHLKMSSAKWRPFCLGLNVLKILVTLFPTYPRWREFVVKFDVPTVLFVLTSIHDTLPWLLIRDSRQFTLCQGL